MPIFRNRRGRLVGTVWTDGCCYRNGSGNPKAGYGTYWGDEHYLNSYGPLPSSNATNNRAELYAVYYAINQAIDEGVKYLRIRTDSAYVKNIFTDWIYYWENNGWKNARGHPVKNQRLIKEIMELIDEHIDVDFIHILRDSEKENSEADTLAKMGAKQY
uniref:RNase H type-1 domain-containing protein n=1 Tax=Panagrolaimus sp. JU765 TaxID=591449 RepID=A0AC34QXJ3_9BILA